jgi:hypothetical protein
MPGIGDHEVHIERQIRPPGESLDHRYTDRQVGYEMTVHDVDMEKVGSSPFANLDGRLQIGQIRCQYGGCDKHGLQAP